MNHRPDDAGSQRESLVLDTATGTEPCRRTTDTLWRLLTLGTLIERNLTRRLRPWRITLGEFQLLKTLAGRELRQGELANELHRSKVTVCRQVKNLIKLGCLHQDVDIADQRAKWLGVTPEGMYLCREAYRALSDTMLDLSLALDPDTRSVFERLQRNAEGLAYQNTKEWT